jgi:hypothetical protein
MLAMPSLKHSFAAELARSVAELAGDVADEGCESPESLEPGSKSPEGPCDSLEVGSGEGPLELSSQATSAIPKASAAVAV